MNIQARPANDTSLEILLSLGTIVVTDANQGYVKHFTTPVTVVNSNKNVTIEVGFSHDGKLYLFDSILYTAKNTFAACEALIASGKYNKIKSLCVYTSTNAPFDKDELVHRVSMQTEEYGIFANVPDLNKISGVLRSELGIPSPL